MNSRRAFFKLIWFGLVGFSIFASTAVSVFITKNNPAEIMSSLASHWDEKEAQETITMLFTGDIMLGRYIATLREKNAEALPDFPFSYMPEVIEKVEENLNVDGLDLVIGNLEGPITDSGYVNPGTSMIFNFKPEVADLLAKVGFTTLDMANNHVYNQGLQGLDSTYTYLYAAGLDGFGHPDTEDGPYSTTIYEFQTQKIGFLGLNDTDFDLDEEAVIAKIKELDEEVDFLVVGIHWGVEYEKTARDWMVNMAHTWVDAGADMIWGHHPHVIQNWELYQGAPIYYSLGNFVFDQYWSSDTQEGLVVGVRIDGEKITTTEVYVDLVNQGEPKPRNN